MFVKITFTYNPGTAGKIHNYLKFTYSLGTKYYEMEAVSY